MISSKAMGDTWTVTYNANPKAAKAKDIANQEIDRSYKVTMEEINRQAQMAGAPSAYPSPYIADLISRQIKRLDDQIAQQFLPSPAYPSPPAELIYAPAAHFSHDPPDSRIVLGLNCRGDLPFRAVFYHEGKAWGTLALFDGTTSIPTSYAFHTPIYLNGSDELRIEPLLVNSVPYHDTYQS